jgi:2,3-bisphosphoglycerate-dependent phosphoglycerate mutase
VPTRLVLIRHGHAQAAADQVIGGHKGCRGLSARGRAQAEALRDRWLAAGGVDADLLLTSTLPRAIETADIVGAAVRAPKREADGDVCEMLPGACDGMPWSEYQANGWFDMAAEPDRPMSEGGESLSVFHERVAAAMRRIVRDHTGETVVIVSHGGFIVASSLELLGAPGYHQRKPFHLEPENTSITEWLREDDDRNYWVFERFNDVAHLENVGRAAN